MGPDTQEYDALYIPWYVCHFPLQTYAHTHTTRALATTAHTRTVCFRKLRSFVSCTRIPSHATSATCVCVCGGACACGGACV